MTFYISDIEMYLLLCLCVICALFGYSVKLTYDYWKADRKREAEADMRRLAYLKTIEQKALWESNLAESEKLFEKGGAKK